MNSKLLVPTLLGFTWIGLWLTPDQQGQRLFDRAEFRDAAETFRDPMWQGTAWFRAGNLSVPNDPLRPSHPPQPNSIAAIVLSCKESTKPRFGGTIVLWNYDLTGKLP
jgi:hypothetical protein